MKRKGRKKVTKPLHSYQSDSDHSYFRLCHLCLYLNEAENDITQCARCQKQLIAEDTEQEEQDSARIVTEVRLTENPSEAEEDFDREELDELEGESEDGELKSQRAREEEDDMRSGDFPRQPLTGLAVVW